jgi:hypothetical protein
MKTARLCLLASLGLLGLTGPSMPRLGAYPPAPHHIIEGVVRDAYGQPLTLPSARILLETVSGKTVTGRVTPEMGRGLNYALTIPMDAGVTAEEYRPTALQPLVPFRLKVRIGNTTYLPIEMTANYATLGQPAQRTRLDLTLGEDSDGDGLPDAWELVLTQQLGGRLTLADIRPEDDLDGDGLTNLQEYLAGTYAYDPAHGILLDLVRLQPGRATLEFTVVRGRTYTVLAGSDVTEWSPVPFQIPGAPDGPVREYRAQDVRLLRVEVAVPEDEPAAGQRFFKLRVQ